MARQAKKIYLIKALKMVKDYAVDVTPKDNPRKRYCIPNSVYLAVCDALRINGIKD